MQIILQITLNKMQLLTFIVFKIHHTILQGIQKYAKTGPDL